MVEEDQKLDMEGDEEEDPGQEGEQDTSGLDDKWKDKIKEKFGIFDKEQTGYIDAKGLGTLLRWLDFNPNETEMKNWVKKYSSQTNSREGETVSIQDVNEIVSQKILEPDTVDEFIEAAKVFDHDNDGKIEVAELRYAMSRLGDPLEDSLVDDLIAELDKEKTGLVDILDWAKITFK